MTSLAAALTALVDRQTSAGRSRGEVLADLRAWVEGEEAAEREAARKPCEHGGCQWDAAMSLEGVWLCGPHAALRLERQQTMGMQRPTKTIDQTLWEEQFKGIEL